MTHILDEASLINGRSLIIGELNTRSPLTEVARFITETTPDVKNYSYLQYDVKGIVNDLFRYKTDNATDYIPEFLSTKQFNLPFILKSINRNRMNDFWPDRVFINDNISKKLNKRAILFDDIKRMSVRIAEVIEYSMTYGDELEIKDRNLLHEQIAEIVVRNVTKDNHGIITEYDPQTGKTIKWVIPSCGESESENKLMWSEIKDVFGKRMQDNDPELEKEIERKASILPEFEL